MSGSPIKSLGVVKSIGAHETQGEPPFADDRFTRERSVLARLLHDRAALVALGLLGALVLIALLAPYVLTSPYSINVPDQFASPSFAHPLGTDELGRDLLSRAANAGRLSLGIAALSTILAMVAGTVWGFLAGSRGGILDELLMRIVDTTMAIPLLLFALILVAALGTSVSSLAVVIGLLMIPFTARVTRAAILSELAEDYTRALTAVGTPRWRILFVEILPNTAPALLAQTSLNLASALVLEATLGFLGLGVQPPAVSWGTLLQAGYAQLYNSVWYPIVPAVAIVVAVASLNTIGDRLQRMLDRA